MATFPVVAFKTCYVNFTVEASTKPEIEKAIEEKLRSDLVWVDDSIGINAESIWNNRSWKIRRRFLTKDE
jgi:hypothetical protein